MVLEKSIYALQEQMEQGTLTSRDLVLFYMERIGRYDQSGLCLRSVAEINPDALFIAEAMDRERKIKGVRGPLHGIPVLLKDNIDTGDKMRTTAGSVALQNHFPLQDAPLVTNLRKQGAVILGKANLSEFARYMATETVNGYSSFGGQVLNPYDINKDVSGSSSGSSVSASCDFCAVAIGTETEGSIVGPSMANGAVGLKPTIGLVSRAGIIPIANQDSPGPIGKSVTDVAIVLSAIAGGDGERDAATLCTEHLVEDYTKYLIPQALSGMRVGINRSRWEELSADEQTMYEQAVTDMATAGATIVDHADVANVYSQFEFESRDGLMYEFRLQMDAYFARNGASGEAVKSLADIIAYNQEHATEALKYGQDILTQAQFQTSGRLTEPAYLQEKVRILNKSQRDGVDKVMAEHQLDVLVCPGYTDLAPIAGYPVIVVPAGFTSENMPYGISFMARAFEEGKIIQAAYGYEQCSHRRKAPDLDRAQTKESTIQQSAYVGSGKSEN